MVTTQLELQEMLSTSVYSWRFEDVSFYDPALKVENGLLEITAPGSSRINLFKVTSGFKIILNSSNLKIVPAKNASQLVALPDGVYNIRYSIRPNLQMYVEYNVLRNTKQLQRYISSVSELFSERCNLTKKEFQCKKDKLSDIKERIHAAKWMVDEFNKEDRGLELYDDASRLLDEYNNCGC